MRGDCAGHGRQPDEIGALCHNAIAGTDAFQHLNHPTITHSQFDGTAQKCFATLLHEHNGAPRVVDDG
jgi:hypothetical protein